MQFHPQFLFTTQFINMSTHKVSMKGEHPPRFEDQIINKHQFCNYCGYSTDRAYNLNQHLKTHNAIAIKTFSCNYCKFSTEYKPNLNRHLKRKHVLNQPSFKCNYCAFSSEYKYNLNQHLEKVHQLLHHIILTPTPPKLMHFDDRATWKTLSEVLQERDKVYIGPHRELLSGGNLPQTANIIHWNNTKLLHMLYRRKITVEKYVELYEEYAREKLWNHLEQLDAMTLVYGDKDGGRNQAIILRRLFVEKFFNKIE